MRISDWSSDVCSSDLPQYSLGDLKRMPAHKLLDIAEQLGISDAVARARKQDVIFALLKVLTRTSEGVQADGVLGILPDGFGFLTADEPSHLAGHDATYISPHPIRPSHLRTGHKIRDTPGRGKERKKW